jgi:2'-5' RNA ligase
MSDPQTSSRKRYFVGIALPETLRTLFDEISLQATGQASPIGHPHITLLFPFFLKEGVAQEKIEQLLSTVECPTFQVVGSKLGAFYQKGKTILVIHVEPKGIFTLLHQSLTRVLAYDTEPDTSRFSNGKLPQYDSHLTLHYDAGDVMPTQALSESLHLERIEWNVNAFALFEEKEKGVWEKIEHQLSKTAI